MAVVYLTRVEKFNAAHKLWISEWTEEENFAYFGKCANKNWHGHNYTPVSYTHLDVYKRQNYTSTGASKHVPL